MSGSKRMGTRPGLWDDAVDGDVPKSSRAPRTGKRWGFWLGAGFWALALLFGVFVALGLEAELRFRREVAAVYQRACLLGGGVSNGRRDDARHVTVWFVGQKITNQSLPGILSIIRECQSRGLGAHLSLELDNSNVDDDGIALLRGVRSLEAISLHNTKATKEGVNSLRRSLSNTVIDDWPIFRFDRAQIGGGSNP